jgi:hypothetical protein
MNNPENTRKFGNDYEWTREHLLKLISLIYRFNFVRQPMMSATHFESRDRNHSVEKQAYSWKTRWNNRKVCCLRRFPFPKNQICARPSHNQLPRIPPLPISPLRICCFRPDTFIRLYLSIRSGPLHAQGWKSGWSYPKVNSVELFRQTSGILHASFNRPVSNSRPLHFLNLEAQMYSSKSFRS